MYSNHCSEESTVVDVSTNVILVYSACIMLCEQLLEDECRNEQCLNEENNEVTCTLIITS